MYVLVHVRVRACLCCGPGFRKVPSGTQKKSEKIVKIQELPRDMDMKEKKTANYIRLQKGSGQRRKKKEKTRDTTKEKKEIQMRWMQSPPSTTDGFEKGKASA